MWTAMERFLRAFEGTSIQASLTAADGTPRFVPHDDRTNVGGPVESRTRARPRTASKVAPQDSDSSDESVF
jgi:hypothetical protein